MQRLFYQQSIVQGISISVCYLSHQKSRHEGKAGRKIIRNTVMKTLMSRQSIDTVSDRWPVKEDQGLTAAAPKSSSILSTWNGVECGMLAAVIWM